MKLFNEYKGLRRELYILFIGRVMTNLGSMIWPMFTLILNQKLGMSAGTIAAYMMVYSIVSMPINLLGGKLADRYNKKNIIIICDGVSILAYLYCAAVPISMRSILIFVIASLFQSIEWPSYDALVADFTTSADRSRAYSLSYLGSNLGLMLSPTIGGLLLNRHLNLAFLINGVAIAVSTILIAIFIRDIHREVDDSAQGEYEAGIDSKVSAISYILKNPVILLFILASLVEISVYNMFGYLMPLDLSAIHGENGSVFFGTMNSVNCVIVVLFTAVITRLFRRKTDIHKMILGFLLLLAGFALFVGFTRLAVMCYVAIIIFTFGEIFLTLSMSPFLTRRIPATHRGRIIAVQNVFCSIFCSVIQYLIGVIYDKSGSLSAWGVVFLFGALELVLLFIMKRKDRARYPALYTPEAICGSTEED